MLRDALPRLYSVPTPWLHHSGNVRNRHHGRQGGDPRTFRTCPSCRGRYSLTIRSSPTSNLPASPHLTTPSGHAADLPASQMMLHVRRGASEAGRLGLGLDTGSSVRTCPYRTIWLHVFRSLGERLSMSLLPGKHRRTHPS